MFIRKQLALFHAKSNKHKTRNKRSMAWLDLPVPNALFFALLFAGIGILWLFRSIAATPTASLEAESGTRTGQATVLLDSTASQGKAIQFKQAAATSSTYKLRYKPPALTNPQTIEVTSNRTLMLGDADYIIKLPANQVISGSYGLKINGGRNIVLIGGQIYMPDWYVTPSADSGRANSALVIEDTYGPGNVYIEGLAITGKLGDAIRIQEGARGGPVNVFLQNIRVPDSVIGTQAGWHADLIQTWAFWGNLYIDHFYGRTGYQGFRVVPNEEVSDRPGAPKVELSNVEIIGDTNSKILLTLYTNNKSADPAGFLDTPMTIDNVWIKDEGGTTAADQLLWDRKYNGIDGDLGNDIINSTDLKRFTGVKVGNYPASPIVPVSMAGLNYVSPGYQ